MKFSDLTLLSKLAIGLAIGGFIFSVQFTSNINGACSFIDYGKLILGGLAAGLGGLGEVSALRLGETRMVNLIASGVASMAGVLLVLMGLGIIGGPC